VTRAKLFFNNSTKQIGLVGFWVIANALVHAYYGGPITAKVVPSPDPLVVSNSGTMIIDRELALAGGTS
jgi:hypothetical protein